jgi:Flp pilus assembly CpaF family ATPase
VEILEVRSNSFGRRAVDTGGRELVPVDQPFDGVVHLPDSRARSEHKERVRNILLTRIDSTAVARLPRMALRAEIARLVHEIATSERLHLNEIEENAFATELTDDLIGLGPLEPLLDDEEVTDILVNGPHDVYVERLGKLEKTTARFRDVQHVVNVAQRIAAAVGRRIDEASPLVDARLADGSRVNIVLSPLVLNGGTISIRKFPKYSLTLEDMVRNGNLSPAMARFLEITARIRANVLISGGSGSGKTTLLNAVSRGIDNRERIITIEDAVELRLQQPHVVQMETRAPNIEGVGAVPQRELVRNALRMRPDRIIVGARELASDFVRAGFRAVTVCIDPRVLDDSFAGRELDSTFFASLPPAVDACGENGEFHTFVFDGPVFRAPIAFRTGEKVMRDGFLFCDLLPE